MTHRSAGVIAREIQTLWEVGTVGEADDSALVGRYSAGRDESAEAAFRVLVDRHGPMVLRVCRQILGDGHDAHDAAQAVFLVLARKAGSIRRRGSVAPWLHGVACRVAARARRRDTVRRSHEARSAALQGRTSTDFPPTSPDWEALHEEVGRLPEKYRAAVVLCYLEGQTYEETARRLGCPLGTVRVRLSRARDRLRDRLTRRGYGPACSLIDVPTAPLPGGWVDGMVRASQEFVTGRAAGAGAVSASALALGQGVLRTMMVTQLKFAAFGLLAAGLLAAGGHALVGQEPSKKLEPAAALKEPENAPVDRERELVLRLVETSRQRLAAQQAFYEEGRITIDRYLDSSTQLLQAELLAATTKAERVAAARNNVDRHLEILKREQEQLEAGRGTDADVGEARQRKDEAEVKLMQIQKAVGPADYEALERRLVAIEQKLDRAIKLLNIMAPGRDDLNQIKLKR